MYKAIINKLSSIFAKKDLAEILTGASYSLIASIVATALSFISTIIISRYYGSAAMGCYVFVNSFFLIAASIPLWGMNSALLKLIPEYITRYNFSSGYFVFKKTTSICVVASLIIGITVLLLNKLLVPYISLFFDAPWVIMYSMFFIVFYGLYEISKATLRGISALKLFANLMVLPSIFLLLMLVISTQVSYNKYNPVYSLLASWFIAGMIGCLLTTYVFRKKGDGEAHRVTTSNILKISTPMYQTALMHMVILHSGILLLSLYHPENEVAYYGVAVKLVALAQFVRMAIDNVIASKFAELHEKGNISDLVYLAKSMSKLIFWFTVPAIATLVVFGEQMLSIFFGAEFSAAYSPMVVLLVALFIGSSCGAVGQLMNMTGKHFELSKLLLISALISIILGFVLIPKYGIVGAAISSSVSMSFWNLYLLIYLRKEYGGYIGYFPKFISSTIRKFH